MTAPFTGVAVALVTLFDDGLAVDLEATGALAAGLVEAGVRAIVTAGTTGEAASLDRDERVALIRAVRHAVPDDVPVIAGTGAPSARQAIAFTRDAAAAGAAAALALSPPSTGDPRPYYEAIAFAVPDIPLLAYHYPAVSSPGISLEHLTDLPVAGCKDSTGDVDRLLAEVTTWDRPVYPGSAAIAYTAGQLGCPGAILALANAEPELCVAAFAGDVEAQKALYPAHAAQRGKFPHGIKALTAKRFGTSTVARMG
ncbi:MAG TPA: dihydrodipicolinate synthase family protein [Acidimicrobiales bacterium]|jgi:4-hydroxy-tetrahydrodipicolinate synthase|nr:dihydrodipicolinate synthase family protein [Acidimicrobiales bacterium]